MTRTHGRIRLVRMTRSYRRIRLFRVVGAMEIIAGMVEHRLPGFINIIFVNHVDLTFATLYKIPLAIPEWRLYNDYGALLRLLWVW